MGSGLRGRVRAWASPFLREGGGASGHRHPLKSTLAQSWRGSRQLFSFSPPTSHCSPAPRQFTTVPDSPPVKGPGCVARKAGLDSKRGPISASDVLCRLGQVGGVQRNDC